MTPASTATDSEPVAPASRTRRWRPSTSGLQALGRALMLPIAVLPVAGILLRLGQPDLLDIPFMAAAGDAIFHNLGLLFAIGVAVGFARDGNGAAGLAGVVCYLVATNGAQALLTVPADAVAGLTGKGAELAATAYRAAALAKLSVPLGTLSGLIAGNFYNRFGNIRLPDYLAFFGGRRFVPIVSGVAGLALAVVFGRGWAALSGAIDALSHLLVAAGPLGLFAYGLLNRLLLVTGLHHILNNIVWFIVGDFHGATGDLNRFFAGDPSAGSFMAGFFPVMIFGLPAGCLAMYRTARPERRAEVGGMLLSLALTAALTGVTEPIEFSFMFLAPVLFALHAVLTGAAMVLMDALHVKLGFGFSAGLLDFALNFGRATHPLLLLPVGLLYAGLYYGLFRWFILRFDLKTPGREPVAAINEAGTALSAQPTAGVAKAAAGRGRAVEYLAALGGPANLDSIDACTTRLRLVVRDQHIVDEAALKRLGARGVIRLSGRGLQVVVGPTADQLAREMRDAAAAAPRTPDAATPAAPSAALPPESRATAGLAPTSATTPAPADPTTAALLEALGGTPNIVEMTAVANRLRVVVRDDGAVDTTVLTTLPWRGAVQCRPGTWHLIGETGIAATAAAIGVIEA